MEDDQRNGLPDCIRDYLSTSYRTDFLGVPLTLLMFLGLLLCLLMVLYVAPRM